MYQALLTRRYLLSKVMPLLAAVAVLLCTAMVLIIWSVMGGFLNMLVSTGRTMTGDVVVQWPFAGFAHYEDLVSRLEKDPLVAGAAPAIETLGTVSLPDGRNDHVLVRGVEGDRYAKVTKFADILWWRPLLVPLEKDAMRDDPRLGGLDKLSWQQVYENGLSLTRPDPKTGEVKPAAVPGIEVSGFNSREPEGFYNPRVVNRRTPNGKFEQIDIFMPRDGSIVINLPTLDSKGRLVDTVSKIFPVANEFQSGVFEMDNKVVLVQLAALQDMLRMNKAKRILDPGEVANGPVETDADGQRMVEDPARVTHVLIKGTGPMATAHDAEVLKARVQGIYAQFAADHHGAVPDEYAIRILTWRDQNAMMISAVEKETALVLFLFMMVSMVAVMLVLAIFWSMVAEKTKDIGVLRAIGAGKLGVAWLWVRYGLVIGVVGALAGSSIAYTVVHNINPIHEWMGQAMGIVIWDPRIYYFVRIPNVVETPKAITVIIVFVISCAVGAIVPAARAANMSPVRALRFE